MPGLGTSFGRGGATTALTDLVNADCILICGSSMAEAHPVGFRFVVAAREKGATVIHVDPRYSRTSALADVWAPLRAGSDIVFLGGLIRYVLENERYFTEYVRAFTNASVILPADFHDSEELGGVFSGWDAAERRYHSASWKYDWDGKRDASLQHERCVLQVLRRHFARYTPALVEAVCGMPAAQFERIAEVLCANSGPDRTSAICYAVGWTQHTTGVQIIRCAAILQLLLGNMGRPGGGIMALRGHASIQGSTDVPTLYNILPGYLPMPAANGGGNAAAQASEQHAPRPASTLRDYIEANRHERGGWHELPTYLINLLKAWYGEQARPDNDWGFNWLPLIDGDHSHFAVVANMADHHVEGYFVMGENPAVGSPNSRLQRRALAQLKWLVVRDLYMVETATFWKDSPEIENGELQTEDIETEVFFLPAASHVEKEGTFTNTQRLLQWREKAVEPPGQARSDAWFIYQLGLRLKRMAEASGEGADEGLRALRWAYGEDEPDVEQVLREINGYEVASGRQVEGFHELRDDGSTACGTWIYSGVFPAQHRNRAAEREPHDALGHGWGWSWPADRRILYNRASARPDGTPWSERKKLIWWDEAQGRWSGLDRPDIPIDKAPTYVPTAGARGMAALRGDAPFVMHEDGLGWLFVPVGLSDGPLPTHYEPRESVMANRVHEHWQYNPVTDLMERPDNVLAAPVDERFPYVLTTYRLTEHHTAGGMSRWQRHLAELQPAMFCELSPELAAEVGLVNGGWVTIVTLRAAIEARVLVTRRMRPLRLGERIVHQVAMPFHFGKRGVVTGDAANDLIPMLSEPNVHIHEAKALTCALRPGRRPRGKALLRLLEEVGSSW